ncbi:unnamed protein product [Candidula unifasciata]|uniref:Dynein heavy chain tail domain-containing protein n=1 Tax=Candidula unifasciata TaxID=100452 RepID=A0A8S3YKG3_9EUPU|nr:unnamed protein product [Candidula unifasciata]
MMGIYAPMFFEYRWPNIIKNDFSLHLHRFLASLTDTRWKLQNKTVLYVTKEGMKIPEAEAAKNKELVKRLEISVIHWARQIKDVLAIQDALEVAENSGPLDEIKFWRNRCADMSGITEQLEQEGVKHITRVLELAKSSYVAPFVKLSGQIKVGTQQAESNLKFMNLLEEPCMKLANAKVSEIPSMLPEILKLIRIIWVNSDFYNTREKLTAILKKLSNEIIRRCCAEIDLDKIFDGYVQSGRKTLLNCIDCCEQWKNIYEESAKLHHKFSSVPWVLDHDAIFAQVDAFIKRCWDMLEVCGAQSHFARQEEGNVGEMPQFAGHKWNEIIRDLNDIKTQFEKCHRLLRAHRKYALDVMQSFWHEAYRRFQAGIRDLEVMMQNAIITAFKTVTTVQGGVELLEVFVHLSSREVIYNILAKLTTELCRLFTEEMNAVKRDMASKDDYRSPSFPKYAGSAHFARMMKNRVQKTMNILERSYFLPKTGIKDDVRTQFKALMLAIDEYIQKTYAEWKALSIKVGLFLYTYYLLLLRLHWL